jgi:C1A family cysteine protease
MVESYQIKGLGWIPDHYNFRDYAPESKSVAKMYSGIRGLKTSLKADTQKDTSASPIDNRGSFTPITDQGGLGSCTAHSAGGLIQYFQKKAYKSYTQASTRFIYKVTRNLLHVTGDTGAYLRTAMGTLTLFGAPPEEFWPYNGAPAEQNPDFDIEPTAFCYAFGQSYQAIKYVRLDQPNLSTSDLLSSIKNFVSKGLPSMFGFTCYESLWQSRSNGGNIPFPCDNENIIGGHAIVVAGYDDSKKIQNTTCNEETTGAFLIRNSWGTNWGEKGYGWFPYEYVLRGIALDFWTVIAQEWVDSGQFGE